MRRVLSYLLLGGLVCVCIAILFPTGHRSRHDARRASCQSNLKQIGLAIQQYAVDYDGQLPLRGWGAPVAAHCKYAQMDAIFQCPETPVAKGTSDYFFNARFIGATLKKVSSPITLVLCGDGQADAPPNATLFLLPAAWRTDKSSSAWRHLDGANYGFADGHVKWLKVNRVNRDFRVVNR